MRSASTLFLLLLVGCSEDARSVCTSIVECPDGYDCVQGQCVPLQASDARPDRSVTKTDGRAVLPDSRLVDQTIGYDAPAGVAADLIAKDLVFGPASLAVGTNPLEVSFKLCNYGPQPVAPPNTRIGANFYFSKNDLIGDSDDALVGSNGYDFAGGDTDGDPIKAGSCVDIYLSEVGLGYLKVPAITAGQYYVFVRADHEAPSKLKDPYPANNATRIAGVVTVK